ncbi:MAG: cysteine desulfurase NifS [Eubacteriales bacterium]|nr:cysteine desulfurase NifS [Eubacteriales bacterium]
MNRIYVDNAATTPVRKEVVDKMLPYYTEFYGNPSAVYAEGQQTKKALDEARETIAGILNCQPKEIFFTGSGTEADNWAIIGAAYANKAKGNHIITSAIEHHAVLHACDYLEKRGFEVTKLPVDEYGIVNPEDLKNALKDNTVLITIMTANNEIGTIQPIKELCAIAKEKGILFHTDAVQATGHIKLDIKDLNVDMLSISGHKFNAPKGVGVLYIKTGTRVHNYMHGGGQERNRRAGTENVAGVIGMAEALRLADIELEEKNKYLTNLRDYFIDTVSKKIPYCRLNGHRTNRLPGNINFSFQYIEGESLLLMLDIKGISASSGSACTSGALDPSHVLLAIGLPHEIAHGSLRISIDSQNTKEEMDYIIDSLVTIVQRLRDMSPLYEEVLKGDK